jgi:Holliday junction resolvase-like predicted endonuclease
LPRPARTDLGRRARRYGRLCELGTLWLLWLRGWDLAGRNLKWGRFELDLLLTRGGELRVIEVKARAAGAWVGADAALGFHQRLRLQVALRGLLDRAPWPGRISFQRASWVGWRCRLHPPERWNGLRFQGPGLTDPGIG